MDGDGTKTLLIHEANSMEYKLEQNLRWISADMKFTLLLAK